MALYTITRTAASYIDPAGTMFFESLCVRNITNKIVYMMRADGQVIALPPLNQRVSSVYDDGIEIQSLQRTGVQTGSDDIPYVDTTRNVDHPLIVAKISSKTLEREAVYVPEFGLAFSFTHLKHLLPQVHRLGDKYLRDAIIQSQEQFITKGASVPFIVSVNSHNSDLDFYYLIINDVLTSVVVNHDTALPEGVAVTFNLGTTSSKWTVPVDLTDPVSTICEFGTKWVMGHDRDAVVSVLTTMRNKSLNKITKEEHEAKITEATRKLSEQLAAALREKEQLQQQVLLMRKDLDNVNQELRQANAPTVQSTEQFLAQQKALTAQYTRDITVAKLNEERDRSSIEFDRKMRSASESHAQEMQLAELKVQKEASSVRSAEITTSGNAVKTAAVVAPIIGSLGYFIYSVARSTSGGLVGAIGGLAVGLASKIIMPQARAPGIIKIGTALLKKSFNVVAKCTSSAMSCIAKAADTAVSVVGSVCRWLTSW